jgi:hypothetical protein
MLPVDPKPTLSTHSIATIRSNPSIVVLPWMIPIAQMTIFVCTCPTGLNKFDVSTGCDRLFQYLGQLKYRNTRQETIRAVIFAATVVNLSSRTDIDQSHG